MQLVLIKCVICCSFGLYGETQNYWTSAVIPLPRPPFLFSFLFICLPKQPRKTLREETAYHFSFYFRTTLANSAWDLSWIFSTACLLQRWGSHFSMSLWEKGWDIWDCLSLLSPGEKFLVGSKTKEKKICLLTGSPSFIWNRKIGACTEMNHHPCSVPCFFFCW